MGDYKKKKVHWDGNKWLRLKKKENRIIQQIEYCKQMGENIKASQRKDFPEFIFPEVEWAGDGGTEAPHRRNN